jgi:hypothetical protein
MDNKAKYPRIVGYKLTVNVDWEDGGERRHRHQ